MVSGTNKVCGGGVPYLWDEVEVELKGRSGPNFWNTWQVAAGPLWWPRHGIPHGVLRCDVFGPDRKSCIVSDCLIGSFFYYICMNFVEKFLIPIWGRRTCTLRMTCGPMVNGTNGVKRHHPYQSILFFVLQKKGLIPLLLTKHEMDPFRSKNLGWVLPISVLQTKHDNETAYLILKKKVEPP